ncbi:MAG: hypothetical protein ACYC2U_08510, partial [Candidatus Amoebophilus sp.]
MGFNTKIVKDVTEGFALVQQGKQHWLKALEALEVSGVERAGLFSADNMEKVKGWPSAGLSLAQVRKEGKHNNNPVYKAMNAFSFYIYSETTADSDGCLVVGKPEKKGKDKAGKGKKKISGKVEELTLGNILFELEAALDREKDIDTLGDAV